MTIAGKGGKARTVELSPGRAGGVPGPQEADREGPRPGSRRAARPGARVGAAGRGGRAACRWAPRASRRCSGRTPRSSGVEKLTPHMLRHTFATNHTLAGDPLTLVQYWMGHSRLETTAIYTQVGPEERRQGDGPVHAPRARRRIERRSIPAGPPRSPRGPPGSPPVVAGIRPRRRGGGAGKTTARVVSPAAAAVSMAGTRLTPPRLDIGAGGRDHDKKSHGEGRTLGGDRRFRCA